MTTSYTFSSYSYVLYYLQRLVVKKDDVHGKAKSQKLELPSNRENGMFSVLEYANPAIDSSPDWFFAWTSFIWLWRELYEASSYSLNKRITVLLLTTHIFISCLLHFFYTLFECSKHVYPNQCIWHVQLRGN